MTTLLSNLALRLRNAWAWLWVNHIQKFSASILTALTAFDLTGYHDSVAAFVTERGYHGLRLALGLLILARAVKK